MERVLLNIIMDCFEGVGSAAWEDGAWGCEGNHERTSALVQPVCSSVRDNGNVSIKLINLMCRYVCSRISGRKLINSLINLATNCYRGIAWGRVSQPEFFLCLLLLQLLIFGLFF